MLSSRIFFSLSYPPTTRPGSNRIKRFGRISQLLSIAFILILSSSNPASAQCTNVISTYPYSEGFESGPAWTTGVVSGLDNWTWGAPAHPTINTAGGGVNAWCIGGLTGSGYMSSAQCYLLSPCFDFSTLNYPWISFKIFWECERQWDGMVLQYTLNGTTWNNVGSVNDPVDCLNQNWYNYGNITWLNTISVRHGWSGRVGATTGSCTGGFGSNGWVTATHCMTNLAGKSNVRFRFLFGSGTSCNAFDGMALDDIFIGEAPQLSADFSFTCGSQNTVSFSDLTGACASAYQWNFGEPASGSANTSSLQNPTHTYASPGTYNVTLVASNSCSAPVSITIPVTIESVSLNTTQVSCKGANDGSIAVITNGAGPYAYSWSPAIGTAASVNNLSPGTYNVTVTPSGGCPVTSVTTITEPPLLTMIASSAPAVVCDGGQVTLSAVASGGTPNYSYEWNPGGLSGSTQLLSPTSGAAYSVEVTDQNGCTAIASTSFAVSPQLSVEIDSDISAGCEPLCVNFADLTIPPQSVVISSWLWDFGDGSSSQIQNPTHCFQDGDYEVTLTLTTSDGCTSTSASPLMMDAWSAPQADFTFTPAKPDMENPEVRFFNLTAGANQWVWNFGDAGSSVSTIENPTFIYADTGTYLVSLIATSDLGCTDTSNQMLTVLPMLTFYMPNSFTPNSDGINDVFMPISMGIQPEGYLMSIYNRWGQLVFSTNNPSKGWDGLDFKRAHEEPMGVYSWHIKFTDHDSNIVTRSGSVLLVR